MTRTFSIIKPDATRRNITGSINNIIEENNLIIVAQKRIKLTKEKAEGFYAVHKDKPFFRDLINYMTSGPVVVQVLAGENAIKLNRELMGNVISQECVYYKYKLGETKVNLYGEAADGKYYYAPVILSCLITHEPQSYVSLNA